MHNVGRALDDVNVDVDVVSHKTVNLNLYWTVNFSFFLSSPPLWIVAIHDLWVSLLLIPVDDVTFLVLCVVLNLKWLTRLDYIILYQAVLILQMCFTVLSVSLSLCSWLSLCTMASSGCFSLLSFSLAPQEQEFLQKQQQELDGALKKIIQQHKLEIATIERDCLNHKQQLMRGRRKMSHPKA